MSLCTGNRISSPESRIYLRGITIADVNETYLGWLNDKEVTRYLETRFQDISRNALETFVRMNIENKDIFFYAIILKEGDRHIGNIKVGPVDRNHFLADVGVIIGETDCWKSGYATEAIRLVSEHSFSDLGLHKLTAGCYEPNKGSLQAFTRCGYEVEGVRRSHCLCDGRYVDVYILGRVHPGILGQHIEKRQ